MSINFKKTGTTLLDHYWKLKDTASHIVIVSRDGINRSSPVVVVVPITKFTSKKKIYPSHHVVKATSGNGLTQDSIVKCEQIRAIAKSRLSHKWGSLGEEDLAKVDAALKIVLSLKSIMHIEYAEVRERRYVLCTGQKKE